MTNQSIGKLGAALTGAAVLSFAVSMIAGFFTDTLFISCFSCIFIAIGFLPFMSSLIFLYTPKDKKAVGVTGLAFGVVYAVLIFLVYFAECTTVHLHPELSSETLSIISYGSLGSLFFNYDLLGYAFMALSTFFVGMSITPTDKTGKICRSFLLLHGIFFPCCLIIPMFPVFTPGTSDRIGTILLEFWCLYFLPICGFGYKMISRQVHE